MRVEDIEGSKPKKLYQKPIRDTMQINDIQGTHAMPEKVRNSEVICIVQTKAI